MRNLKRTLSLALAAVMLMGMMVVGAGAASKDFTDAGEIDNVEAVDVMVALGVLEGGDKGDFQPNSILTREQAAKIICYMLLGPDNAEKLATSGAVFTDVAADRWSAPYIGYCVNLGILAGDGNGSFFPEGKLTGAAFAKMLLVALGYNANTEKYVGDSWTINVATGALNAGILPDGLVLTDELSRQDAAQMALMTLEATMVEYASAGSSVVLPDGTQIITSGASASKVNGSDDKNYDNDAKGDGYQQFCEKYFPDLTKAEADGGDDFGRPAITWNLDGESDPIGVYAEAPDYTIVVSESGEDTNYWANEAKKNMEVKSGNSVYLNGANGDSVTNIGDLEIGDVVEFYDVADGEADKAVVIRYSVDTIDDVRECDPDVAADKTAMEDDGAKYVVELNGDEYYNTEIAGFNAETYVEDAYVAYVPKGGELIASYVPETVDGKVTATGTDYIRVDGTKYMVRSGVYVTLNSEYTFVLDQNGNVIFAEETQAAAADLSEVYYVAKQYPETSTSYGVETTTTYVQAVSMDGTVVEYPIYRTISTTPEKNEGVAASKTNAAVGSFVTFDVNEDHDDLYDAFAASSKIDSDYTISGNVVSGNTELKTSSTKLNNGTRLESDTKYVVVEGDGTSLKVYTADGGVNYEFVSGDALYTITKNVTGNKVAVYVILVTDEYKTSATAYEDVVYVDNGADAESIKIGSTTYQVFEVYDEAGKTVEVTARSIPADGFYTYEIEDKDGTDVYTFKAVDPVVLTEAYDDENGVVYGNFESYYGTLLTLNVANFVDIETANAKIIDLHDKDVYSKSVTSLKAMKDAVDAGKAVYLRAYLDDGAVVIVVEDVVATAQSTFPTEDAVTGDNKAYVDSADELTTALANEDVDTIYLAAPATRTASQPNYTFTSPISRDITIIGDGKVTVGNIKIADGYDATISGLNFVGDSGQALKAGANNVAGDLVVTNCTFEHRYAIYMDGPGTVTVTNCVFNVTKAAVGLEQGVTSATVLNNVFVKAPQFYVENHVSGLIVEADVPVTNA